MVSFTLKYFPSTTMHRKNESTGYDDMVIGIRPVIEAINAGKEIDRVFIQNGLRSDLFKELMGLLKSFSVPYKYVPPEKLNRLTRKNHQGVIAFVSPVVFSSLEELIEGVYAQGRDPLIVILDKITDVRNFGAILRTAESVGVDGVVIPTQGAAMLSWSYI